MVENMFLKECLELERVSKVPFCITATSSDIVTVVYWTQTQRSGSIRKFRFV